MNEVSLPPELEPELERLAASAWRERKQAVESLRAMVEEGALERPILAALASRLLDGMLSSEGLDGRAASQEVMVAIGEPCIPVIVERLRDPGPGRRLLVDLLGELGAVGEEARLVEILADAQADPNLRASAATSLGKLGGEAASRALRGLLADGSEILQVHALDALRTAGVSVPVSELEPLVHQQFTRKAAVALLGRSKDAAALPLLVPRIDDSMAGVRAVAVQGLVNLDEDLTAAGKPGLVGTALQRIGEPAKARIRTLIEHHEREVRGAAIALAAMAADASAVASVLEVMDDPLLQERAIAMVSSLGPAASDALAQAADRAGGERREHFMRLVGALTPGRVDEQLLSLVTQGLQDPSEEVAQAAAEALERVGDRSCLGELYRTMDHAGRLGEAAADAVAAIIRRRGSASHDDLSLLAGSNWPNEGALAHNLCRVVGLLGSHRYAPHLVAMLGSSDVGVRVAAAVALGQLPGEHEGTSALSFALTDEEPQVRAAACRSLGTLSAAGAYSSLLAATADPSPLVRAAAVQALIALDNPVALARFRAIIAEDPVPAVVVHAIAGLGTSGLDQDLTMLMSLCTSEDREVVKASARAVANFPAHRATAALLGLLDHDRWDVRWAAAEVLAARDDDTAVPPLERAIEREDDPLVTEALTQALEKLGGRSRDAKAKVEHP